MTCEKRFTIQRTGGELHGCIILVADQKMKNLHQNCLIFEDIQNGIPVILQQANNPRE